MNLQHIGLAQGHVSIIPDTVDSCAKNEKEGWLAYMTTEWCFVFSQQRDSDEALRTNNTPQSTCIIDTLMYCKSWW